MTASRVSGLIVSPSMLKFKAKQIAKSLGIGDEEFSASNGWYMRFRNCWNIGVMLLHGEGGEVDKNDPVLIQKLEELKQLIDKYAYKNVYIMDETGLFYPLISLYTLLLPTEDPSTAQGKKVAKRLSHTGCLFKRQWNAQNSTAASW